MVKLTRIYTRGGDGGQTSLGDGARVAKHDPRVAAYGTVDETNATIGLARLHTEGALDAMLGRVQNDLFDLGADLCTPEAESPKHPPLRVTAGQVTRLEEEIDRLLDALGESHRVSLSGVIHAQVVADLADDHLARVEAHPHRHIEATLQAKLVAVEPDLVSQA